jgi:dienelactone hydrolase
VKLKTQRAPWFAFLIVLIFFALTVCADADEASEALKMPPAPMNEKVLSVFGDPDSPVTLQVTLFEPPGPGPFPLAVMNHGATGNDPPGLQPRYRQSFSAYYFLSRGYAVVLPMMRGYAGSGGKLTSHGCDLAALGLADAKDIRAVIEYMVRQPDIDGTRILVAGQSFGGWNTLALGTLDIPNVKGLVSFAGGVRTSGCGSSDSSLIDAAGELGKHTKVPSIWFWGDNDQTFSPSIWRSMYQSYRAAGGPAELVAYGNFMVDSHNLLGFPESLAIIGPKLDSFLGKIGLPNQMIHPEYLPMPVPPPSHFAALDDVAAVPFLTEPGRALYQRFLGKPLPRAVAIAPNGNAASENGGFDPYAKALNMCRKSTSGCRLYAVDNDVVWTKPAPPPPPSKFAGLENQNAVPFLDDKGRAGYERFLTLQKPRAFVIAPDGGWAATARGGDPLTAAMENCSKRHQGCKVYAVDDNVVWTPK